MEQFIKVLKSYGALPVEDVEKLRQAAVRLDVKKGELIQTIHHPVDQLLFVEKGLLMGFSFDDESRSIDWFSKENEFMVLMKSIVGDKDLDALGVEALEDSIIWTFPDQVIDSMVGPRDAFGEQFMIILKDDLMRTHERTKLLVFKDANYWYSYIRQTAPSLLPRVPLTFLANYMRIPERELRQVMKNGIVKINMMGRRRREVRR